MNVQERKSVIDRLVEYGVARFTHARATWHLANPPKALSVLPELMSTDDMLAAYTGDWSEAERARVALTVSWILADIERIASEFSAAGLNVVELGRDEEAEDFDHPFEALMRRPNPDMGGAFLKMYTAMWLALRGKAFWFLAPARSSLGGDLLGGLREIYPMQTDRVKVIPSKDSPLIDSYVYTPRSGGKPFRIEPQYVCYLRKPHPFDLYDGLNPLAAAELAIETDLATSQWQRDAYKLGRGIPSSIVLVNPDMGDRDFAVLTQRLREDFSEERKIAVARGKELSVSTVGLTQKDLETIRSREFSRDEIDRIFLGIEIAKNASDAWLSAADKLIKETRIYPLHVLAAEQITLQILTPFYGPEYKAEFEDVRVQDRSIRVQELNVNSRAMTLNEFRSEIGESEFENKRLPGLGDLPVSLANDPQFVLTYFDLKPQAPALPPGQGAASAQAADGDVGSLPDSDDPENTLGREAMRALSLSGRDDLKRWRKVALRELRAGRDPAGRDFASAHLPAEVVVAVKAALALAADEGAVRAAFEPHPAQDDPLEAEVRARLGEVLAALAA